MTLTIDHHASGQEVMVAESSPHIRFPDDDLIRKVRVIAHVNRESVGSVLSRLARGAVEAEFSQLPEGVQKRVNRRFRLSPPGRPKQSGPPRG